MYYVRTGKVVVVHGVNVLIRSDTNSPIWRVEGILYGRETGRKLRGTYACMWMRHVMTFLTICSLVLLVLFSSSYARCFFFYLAYFIGYLRRSDLGGERGRGLRALPDQTIFRFQFPVGKSTIEIGHRATK